MDSQILVNALIMFSLFLPILAFHEAAHAWMSWKLGDNTAKDLGRLTLNPIPHIDPIGTLLVPGINIFMNAAAGGFGFGLIGWGKPVPVNSHNLERVRRDEMLIAMAGPVSNLILAWIAIVIWWWVPSGWEPVRDGLERLASFSIFLGVFNMIPIPPLDGHYLVRHIFKIDEQFLYGNMTLWLVLLLVLVNTYYVRLVLFLATAFILAGMEAITFWLSGASIWYAYLRPWLM